MIFLLTIIVLVPIDVFFIKDENDSLWGGLILIFFFTNSCIVCISKFVIISSHKKEILKECDAVFKLDDKKIFKYS